MADGKKSFLLYTNYIDLLDGYDEDGEHIEGMTDEEAGKWIKTIFRYVNDLNPSIPNEIKQAFILVRKDLKQDLKKYENKVKSIENARKHNENNMKSSSNQTENKLKTDSNQTEISSVNDNVNVNVNVNDIYSDKSLEYIGKENENIYTLTKFLEELQILLGYAITGKKGDIACKLYEEYGYKTAMYEIKKNIDKQSPIGYTYQVLQNQKPQSSGSEWWDKTKRELEEKDKGSEWLENFKKQMEDKQ